MWSVAEASLASSFPRKKLNSTALVKALLVSDSRGAGSVSALVAPRDGRPQTLSGGPHG